MKVMKTYRLVCAVTECSSSAATAMRTAPTIVKIR